MPQFRGVDHFALTVTDAAVSRTFYTEVLGFLPVMDVGYGFVLLHKGTGFTIAVIQHPEGKGGEFTELTTGLDHLGFAVADRAELEAWEERLREHGVPYTPIRDMPLGHHLNFRDPDGIALEFSCSTEAYAEALAELRVRDVPDEEVWAIAERLLGSEVVYRP